MLIGTLAGYARSGTKTETGATITSRQTASADVIRKIVTGTGKMKILRDGCKTV